MEKTQINPIAELLAINKALTAAQSNMNKLVEVYQNELALVQKENAELKEKQNEKNLAKK